MNNIKVYVEGNPEAVAKFFKEMGNEQPFASSTGLVRGTLPSVNWGEGVLKVNAETIEVETKNTSESSAPQTEKVKKKGASTKKAPEPVEHKTAEKVETPQVEDSAPDFSDLPKAKEEAPEPEKPGLSREEVKAVLKEYGVWVLQQGIDRKSARPYLVALLKKFGEGATGTPELEEKCFDAVFEAAKNRVPLTELEEYL